MGKGDIIVAITTRSKSAAGKLTKSEKQNLTCASKENIVTWLQESTTEVTVKDHRNAKGEKCDGKWESVRTKRIYVYKNIPRETYIATIPPRELKKFVELKKRQDRLLRSSQSDEEHIGAQGTCKDYSKP